MSIPKINPTMLAASRRELCRVAPEQVLRFRGENFRLQTAQLALELFTSLGFNPKLFAPGARILIMSDLEYARFNKACGFVPSAGIYPLSMNGDMDAVNRGELAFLPDRSRNLVLPKSHRPITLTHELLHDIFVGGGLDLADRTKFISDVLYGYRLSVDPKMPHQHANRPFYEEIADSCAQKYSLGKVEPRYNLGRPDRDPAFRLFAGECFAYVGEFMMHPRESHLKSVPDILLRFFRSVRVFERNAYQAANGRGETPSG